MDAIDLIRYQTRQAWAWLNMTVEDVTEEQANWQPPGMANSIGATYAHTIITADEDFNMVYDGGETLLNRGWDGRCGLNELPPQEFGWDWHDWATRVRLDWSAFREYAAEVERCVESFLDRLSPEALAKPVDMTPWGLGTWTGLNIYILHGYDHPKLHGGEISCLKGLQGAHGWRTGWRPDIDLPGQA